MDPRRASVTGEPAVAQRLTGTAASRGGTVAFLAEELTDVTGEILATATARVIKPD